MVWTPLVIFQKTLRRSTMNHHQPILKYITITLSEFMPTANNDDGDGDGDAAEMPDGMADLSCDYGCNRQDQFNPDVIRQAR